MLNLIVIYSHGDKSMKTNFIILTCCLLLFASSALAEELVITIRSVTSTGVGPEIGTITVSSSPFGAIIKPDLSKLSPGLHGFHIHQNPNCGSGQKDGKMAAGLAAGGHYDPADTGKHKGPYEQGHRGDLPAIYADTHGKATHPVLAPRVKLSDLKSRSLMIHQGGDNYSDDPKKLGGGGARVACGVIN
jgi:Cu-Zn family superoxide dismutase